MAADRGTQNIWTRILAIAATLAAASCDRDEIRLEPGVFLYVADTPEVAAEDGYSSANLVLDEDAEVPLVMEYTSVDDQRQYRVEYAITAEAIVDTEVEYTTERMQVTRLPTGAVADPLELAKWRERGSVRSEGSGENLTVNLGASAPRVFFWIGDL